MTCEQAVLAAQGPGSWCGLGKSGGFTTPWHPNAPCMRVRSVACSPEPPSEGLGGRILALSWKVASTSTLEMEGAPGRGASHLPLAALQMGLLMVHPQVLRPARRAEPGAGCACGCDWSAGQLEHAAPFDASARMCWPRRIQPALRPTHSQSSVGTISSHRFCGGAGRVRAWRGQQWRSRLEFKRPAGRWREPQARFWHATLTTHWPARPAGLSTARQLGAVGALQAQLAEGSLQFCAAVHVLTVLSSCSVS